MLTMEQRSRFIIEHVAITDSGALVRITGHLKNKPIVGERFLTAGRQLETAAVREYLSTGQWPCRPNRRNRERKRGAETKAAREAADHRLVTLMRQRPGAGVRELAALIGMSHPCVSRRVARLKLLGMIDHDSGLWSIEAPFTPRTVWVRPISAFVKPREEHWTVQRFG